MTSGTKVTVGIWENGSVEGWLYADTPLGTYIALDPRGDNIRFIPHNKMGATSYHYESPKADFASEAEEIDGEFHGRMYEALWRVDFNHIGRLGRRIHELEYRVRHYEGNLRPYYYEEDRESSLVLSLEAREIYVDLLDEIFRSGLGDVLLTFGERIRQQASMATMPLIDGYIFSGDLLSQLQEFDNLKDSNLGRTLLEQVTPARIVKTAELEAVGDKSPEEISSLEKQESTWARRLKRVAAVGKMTIGGGLTISNIGLGAVAGVVSALPTLGLGTVAAVVGIATSTYTGLNAACDGLRDLAGTLEAT